MHIHSQKTTTTTTEAGFSCWSAIESLNQVSGWVVDFISPVCGFMPETTRLGSTTSYNHSPLLLSQCHRAYWFELEHSDQCGHLCWKKYLWANNFSYNWKPHHTVDVYFYSAIVQ